MQVGAVGYLHAVRVSLGIEGTVVICMINREILEYDVANLKKW